VRHIYRVHPRIPEVPGDSPDYNMSTEHDILDSKIQSSAIINDPTYPGPDGKMFIFKRNLTLYLAQTKLNKAISDHVCFASEILDLPPSYKMRKVKIIATPPDKDDTKGKNKTWTENPDGTPKKRLIFSKSGRLLEDLEVGSMQEITEPCQVPKKVRQLLEMHCYVSHGDGGQLEVARQWVWRRRGAWRARNFLQLAEHASSPKVSRLCWALPKKSSRTGTRAPGPNRAPRPPPRRRRRGAGFGARGGGRAWGAARPRTHDTARAPPARRDRGWGGDSQERTRLDGLSQS
jgi:hypothetical protein